MKKTVWKRFSYMQSDDFADYLMDMASQGWHFKEWKLGLVFEKGEPEDVTYVVNVFDSGTIYDAKPEPHTKEFAEYCEVAGWQLIDAKKKFCIFKKIREDAIDIVTPEERLDSILKAAKTEELWTIPMAAFFTFRYFIYELLFNMENVIFDNVQLLFLVVWPILLIGGICRWMKRKKWEKECRRKLERGEVVEYRKRENDLPILIILESILITMLLCSQEYLILVVLVVLHIIPGLCSALVAKIRPSKETNHAMQIFALILMIVFGIAVLYSMDRDTSKEMKSAYRESVFGSHSYSYQNHGKDVIFYDLYESDHDWIINRIWENEMEDGFYDDAEECTLEWEAEKAYHKNTFYLIKYEERILVLCDGRELSQEQIDIIREQLEKSRWMHG